MKNKNDIKWDIKRGYSVYKSVYTKALQKWIRDGTIKKDEVFVWTSGMSGWRRPEELVEFKSLFEKIEKRKKRKARVSVPVITVKERKRKKQKIVIIEDEKDLCWLLENGLKKRHYNVNSVNSGREGLELVKQGEPNVVLLDLRLKDVDGFNVLHKIKELWKGTKVIIISAFGTHDVKEKATKLGADGFVDKPFVIEDILKAIKKVV